MKKGIIWQVYTKLNRDEYLKFIHDPKHMIDPPDVIMFDNKFIEYFSKTPWFALVLVYLPLIILNIIWSFNDFKTIHYLFLFFIGFILWSFTEYTLHRFVFHYDDRLGENNSVGYLIHFFSHGIHHAFPMDR